MRISPYFAASIALWATAIGCSSSDGPPQPGSGSGGAAGAAGSAAQGSWPCEKTSALELSGAWAAMLDLQLALTVQTGGSATLCPEHQTNRARIVMLIQTSQAPGSTTIDSLRPVFCSIELPALTAMVGQCDPSATNGLTVDLLLSAALQKSLPSIPSALVAAKLSSLTPGASFQPERFTLTAGTRKMGTNMPSWLGDVPGCGVSDVAAGRSPACAQNCVDDCSALVDDDQDGRAAVTFHVCGYSADDLKSGVKCNADNPSEAGITIQGPMLMAFQVDPLLQGSASSSCEVRGNVDAKVVYHVVGGDMYLANTQIGVQSAMRSLPLFDVDSTQSRFRMVRVDGTKGAPDWKIDPTTDPIAACQAVLARRNELE